MLIKIPVILLALSVIIHKIILVNYVMRLVIHVQIVQNKIVHPVYKQVRIFTIIHNKIHVRVLVMLDIMKFHYYVFHVIQIAKHVQIPQIQVV